MASISIRLSQKIDELKIKVWKVFDTEDLLLAVQVHGASEGADPAALPAEDLHLVLVHPAQVLQIQDTDEDRLQDGGQ